jgi:hypothetical protein
MAFSIGRQRHRYRSFFVENPGAGGRNRPIARQPEDSPKIQYGL